MRFLVTGASGFIGCRLAQWIAQSGHEVLATGRAANAVESGRIQQLQRVGVKVHTGSLLDPGFAASLVSDCQAVIHLAAAQHEGNVPDAYFRSVNVDGTRALIDAATAAGVRRFVYGSTIGIYGSARDGELNENSPARPENIYGQSKYEAELLVANYRTKIETCIVRISETYGPGDFRLLKLFRAIDKGTFLMLGSGDNLRQVIYVDDLARGLLSSALHPAAINETFVFPGNEVMTTAAMVAQIGTALGRRPARLHLPIWPFRAAAAILETTCRPLGIQPPLTQRRLDFFTKSFVFSTAKYQRLLSFVPQVTFAAGAAKTVQWYRENALL